MDQRTVAEQFLEQFDNSFAAKQQL